jgi:hypothetical protein
VERDEFDKLGDLKHVQRVLRHADSSITDRYVHSDMNPIVEGVEVLAEEILAKPQANGAPTVTQTSELVN